MSASSVTSCTCRSLPLPSCSTPSWPPVRPWAEARRLPLAGVPALEKFYRAWGTDITANDTPFEAGLGAFVKLGRSLPFIGREALEEGAGKPLRKRLCGFTTEDPEIILSGRETILRNGEFAGYLTSGGYGYTVACPSAWAMSATRKGWARWLNSGRYALVVANDIVPARLHQRPLYDPDGLRVRAEHSQSLWVHQARIAVPHDLDADAQQDEGRQPHHHIGAALAEHRHDCIGEPVAHID